uniref:Iron-sulfur clusters transporter ABCB7, mitochondrial n=1 Tax=Panagrellus redivivus TaxID=6233 RepID=A0A7E4V5I9_PANRE
MSLSTLRPVLLRGLSNLHQSQTRLYAFSRSPVLRNGLKNAGKGPKLTHTLRAFLHSGPIGGVPITGVGAAQPSGREVIQRLLRYVWPKGNWRIKGRVVFALTLLFAAKVLNVLVPFLLRDVINYYNGKAPETLQLNLDSPVATIVTVGFALIVAYGIARAGASLFNELRNAVFAKVAHHSVRSIAGRIFLHLHNLDLSFHLNRQTGALSKAIDRGTRGMSFTLSALIFNVIPTSVEVALVMGIFYSKCGLEFAQMTAGCLGMYGIATLAITRWRTKFRHQMNQADNDAGNKAVDSLINYETVKYFNNEKFEAARYDHFLKQYEKASLKTSASLALLNFTQNAIFSCGLIGVMCLSAKNIQNGSMTVGDLVLANTLLFQLSVPLNFLGSVYREIRQGLLDMQTMFSLMNLKSTIIEKPNATELVVSPDQSTINIKDVTFGYLKEQPILNGLTLEIPTGKKVAIVGGSGSGKSTIVRLLYRLYDAETGSISVNGQDTKDVTLRSLRKAMAIVPQDSVLFHDTIFYNLQYGNPNASPERVYEVARMADIHDAILRMPNGYNTVVGERGLKLSGGEKQRVAIARAILKDADVIVYDEATSSLDAITEENIMNSLRSACRGKTSLFIAHRLATIVDADLIYVLDKGHVIESGSHVELLSKPDSRYAELWNSQHKYSNSGGVPPKIRDKSFDEVLAELEAEKCCGTTGCSR